MINYFKNSLLLVIIFSFFPLNSNPEKKFTLIVDLLSKWGPSSIKKTLVKGDASFTGATTIEESEVQGITSIMGAATIKKSTLNTLDLKGACDLFHVIINGNAIIKGASDFSQVTIYGKTNIYGATSAGNSTFKNTLSISGALTAWDSQFTDLCLSATKTKLNNCTIQTIIVDTTANSWKLEIFGFCLYEKKYESYLILNDCIIDGDIIFKGPAGTVVVNPKTVIKGKIINGVIVQQK